MPVTASGDVWLESDGRIAYCVAWDGIHGESTCLPAIFLTI